MEGLIGPNYKVGNQAFLQALMARGTLTYDEARPILAAIWNADDGSQEHDEEEITEEIFEEYINLARQAVSLFDYEVRRATHQKTKEHLYALINTTSDPQTQLATTFTADELAFIKRLLVAIFESHNSPRMEVMAITQMQAIKLARPRSRPSQAHDEESTQVPTDRGLKHSEVEDVLANMTAGGWLEKSREGFYSLSPRALLELRPWLIEEFNSPDAEPDEWQPIKTCAACKEIITYGLRCAEPLCNLRLHDICEDAFWRSRGNNNCPKCARAWTGKNYVGERAVTKTDAHERRRTAGGARRSNAAEETTRHAQPNEGDSDDQGVDSDDNS
ncbi:putative DNA repair protein Nse1 [Emericellopsis atlantica]|uniref:Non-structural maintenance of chromosomes element 1 homolog n=1 Tax=Emericellopsis atlantica TaxID=2614577 RepID=A0A9P7ZSM1_9HYPO|nr:putative DNA repair protein Nse1 [Emericellopsis atlantica]KAG9257351.1 putative DNA repair protein Nse1 [Emericellopsis atlantica]